ncbi:hypothetical protein, partial [Marinilabilia sp.]|uniref:hypothetical protein n=1 Tax=Marinilabilia sp. TaxID=2021252 RepID=UPI0025B9D862
PMFIAFAKHQISTLKVSYNLIGGRFLHIHYIYKYLTHFGVMPLLLREIEFSGACPFIEENGA